MEKVFVYKHLQVAVATASGYVLHITEKQNSTLNKFTTGFKQSIALRS